jgi:hypothetical protein
MPQETRLSIKCMATGGRGYTTPAVNTPPNSRHASDAKLRSSYVRFGRPVFAEPTTENLSGADPLLVGPGLTRA